MSASLPNQSARAIIVQHILKEGEQAVQVFDATGKLLCVIYMRPKGIRVLSKLPHTLEVAGDDQFATDLRIDF